MRVSTANGLAGLLMRGETNEMHTPDSVARELLRRAGIMGLPGRHGRELLFEQYPIEIRPHPGQRAWITHLHDRSVVLLPHHLRGQDREEVLWHELPHAVCRYEQVGVWVPAYAGPGAIRLALQSDGCHEAYCGRLERALRLPFHALHGLCDAEILAESGVSVDCLTRRREDLLRAG